MRKRTGHLPSYVKATQTEVASTSQSQLLLRLVQRTNFLSLLSNIQTDKNIETSYSRSLNVYKIIHYIQASLKT